MGHQDEGASRPPADAERLTGDPDVDAQLAALAQLDELPVVEHQAVYEAIHAGLRRVLDEDPGDA